MSRCPYIYELDGIIITGKRGGQWRMPKREPKEKVACQEDPALPKEGRPEKGPRDKCPAKPQSRQKGNISRPRTLMK